MKSSIRSGNWNEKKSVSLKCFSFLISKMITLGTLRVYTPVSKSKRSLNYRFNILIRDVIACEFPLCCSKRSIQAIQVFLWTKNKAALPRHAQTKHKEIVVTRKLERNVYCCLMIGNVHKIAPSGFLRGGNFLRWIATIFRICCLYDWNLLNSGSFGSNLQKECRDKFSN